MRRVLPLTLVLIAVFGAAPAGAQGSDSVRAAAGSAVVALQSEALAVAPLGVWDQALPPRVQRVVDEYGSFVAGIDRPGLAAWVEGADRDGAAALQQMVAAGYHPSPAVAAALGPLSEADLAALRAGGRLSVDAKAYGAALDELDRISSGAGAAPVAMGASGPGPTVARSPQTVPPSAAPVTVEPPASATPVVTEAPAARVAPTTTARAPRLSVQAASSAGPAAGTSDPPVVAVVILGAVVIAACLGGVRVARRRRASSAEDGEVDRLLDAARRLGGALEPEAVALAAVEEAVRVAGAAGAALRWDADGPGVLASSDPVAEETALGDQLVARVLATGHASRGQGAQASVLAAPVVLDGRIAGALVVHRAARRPFDSGAQDLLCRLSPLVATALEAAHRHGDVAELTLTDGLTSLANRRRLDRDLPAALTAGSGPVAFLMIDVDHFKTYNDTHGHLAGDEVLRGVARAIAGNVRPCDVVYRYGGEEFCVLLPGADLDDAAVAAERVRVAVEQTEFAGAESQPGGRITVSVGLATAERSDATDLQERADSALYAAKHHGRNRVEVAGT